jgi:hypothetical protein
MCNHLNLKMLIHIFTIICLIMIVIIMRCENFVAHRCAEEHRLRITALFAYVVSCFGILTLSPFVLHGSSNWYGNSGRV